MTLSAALFFENLQVMASVTKKGYKQVEQGFVYILSNDIGSYQIFTEK